MEEKFIYIHHKDGHIYKTRLVIPSYLLGMLTFFNVITQETNQVMMKNVKYVSSLEYVPPEEEEILLQH